MKIAVYPGSFDPVTKGHIDIIKRASALFDKLIVAVLYNSEKTALFSAEERKEMLRQSLSKIENVEVDSFSGLLVDYMKKVEAKAIVRGLRAVSDFEYEFQMALTNKELYSEVDTVFLTASAQYMYLSSYIVREVASYDGDIKSFVPLGVDSKVKEKIRLLQNKEDKK